MLKLFYALMMVLMLAACNEKAGELSAHAKQKQPNMQAEAIKLQCDAPTNPADYEEEQACRVNTKSLQDAYVVRSKEIRNRMSQPNRLRITLPMKSIEDKFDSEELWITYKWLNSDSLSISVEMAGGEDVYVLKQGNQSISIVRTSYMQ